MHMAAGMTKIQKADKGQGNTQQLPSEPAALSREESGAPRSLQDEDIIEYIADMLIPLRQLAIDANTGFLSYLIEMAIEEAHLQCNRKN